MATLEDFQKIDIRVGRVLDAKDFPEARKPSYKLSIDFGGEVGVKQSSAQICELYSKEELKGRLVLGVVNFPARRIAGFRSEVLVLGVDGDGGVVLIQPERDVSPGARLY